MELSGSISGAPASSLPHSASAAALPNVGLPAPSGRSDLLATAVPKKGESNVPSGPVEGMNPSTTPLVGGRGVQHIVFEAADLDQKVEALKLPNDLLDALKALVPQARGR